MQLEITVDGNSVSTLLDTGSTLTITKQMSNRNPTAGFSLKLIQSGGVPILGSDYLPQYMSEVIITNVVTSVMVFHGYVTTINITQKSGSYQRWDIACVGLEYLLENTIIDSTASGVNDGKGSITWSGLTDQQIIQDAFTNNLPEITTDSSTVNTVSVAIDFVAKDISLRALLDQLSLLSGADWRVREDKALLWYASGSIVAPFGGFSDQPNTTVS